MALNLRSFKRHAKSYVELEADTKVTKVSFVKRYAVFGIEDVVLRVETTDQADPDSWVIGGGSPINLYSVNDFRSFDEAYTFHIGLMLRVRDRAFVASDQEPDTIGYDAFICHAGEDKRRVVKPLATHLQSMGFRIWYDEFELTVGDSLRQSIDRGLATSNYGIIVLSKDFFAKNWPQYELNGLVAREMDGQKVILPVWHRVSRQDVLKYSPTLADRVALSTAQHSVRDIALALAKELRTAGA